MLEGTLHTPQGVRDVLPEEARAQATLQQRLSEHFTRWGYDPVATPTFELFDVLRLAGDAESDEQLYRFVDRDGSIVALRPEMTVPIARMVASRLQNQVQPLRLQYTGSVFRYDEPQAGRLREFTQAGVELIGAPGPQADAEVIALTISALVELGLSGFRMDIGHVGFASSVLASLGLPVQAQHAIRQSLLSQDYVSLQVILDEYEATDEARANLQQLISLRGDHDILARALPLARTDSGKEALENVAAVYRHLQAHGVAGWVRIDLGMLKPLDYYTGIIVEGYTDDMGYTLCTGGRYDTLLQRFGCDMPATGLAIGVERLLLAMNRAGCNPRTELNSFYFVADENRLEEACNAAWRMRSQGCLVELDVHGHNTSEALRYAADKQLATVVFFSDEDGDNVRIVNDGEERRVSADEFLTTQGATS